MTFAFTIATGYMKFIVVVVAILGLAYLLGGDR